MQAPTTIYYGDLTDSPMPYQGYASGPYATGNNAVLYPMLYGKNNFHCNNAVFFPLKNNASDCGSGYYQMVPLKKGEPCQNKNWK
jgi:hypothetical protein